MDIHSVPGRIGREDGGQVQRAAGPDPLADLVARSARGYEDAFAA